MSSGIRIVLPYRPFPPESDLHKELADFDWIAAIRMLTHTAQLTCRCPVHVITDVDTDLPVPALKYETRHRRLMLWNLEVCLKYLESPDFDRDTIVMDSDQLIYQDLAPWFIPRVDYAVCIRRDNHRHDKSVPRLNILNGVQWLPKKGRKHLQRFYREALALAETLPEDRIVWGADTDALQLLLEPLEVGITYRRGMWIRMVNSQEVIEALSERHIQGLSNGEVPWPVRPVMDFRHFRKPRMAPYYKATILAQAVA